jgi:hypothetical protein
MEMSAVTQLRAVLDDLERAASPEESLRLVVLDLPSGREAVQRNRRRRLEARGRFARSLAVHSELGVDKDLGPENITALEAVDPEAAEAFETLGSSTGWNQVAFVHGKKTVRLYVNGSYAYTLKQGSSLLVDYGGRARRWELEDWVLWPLEDVIDIAPRVLEEYPALAQAWRGITTGDHREEEERHA